MEQRKPEQKAILDIESKGKGNYLLTAKGCHLKYFSIYPEGQSDNKKESVEGKYDYYHMSYSLVKNITYKFEVFDGLEEKDKKGEMIYKT